MAKGLADGIARGRSEGRTEGQLLEKKKIAQKMLFKGMSVGEVIDITGLSEKEIKALK